MSFNELETIKFFHSECERYDELIHDMRSQCKQDYLENVESSVRYEHSVGGEVMMWGYYSLSPITDLIVGGVNRGKLLKRMTYRSKPTHKYYFDENEKLTAIDILDSSHYVVIYYLDDTVIGIRFNDSEDFGFSIESLVEAKFDSESRIISYSEATYSLGRINEIYREIFFYDETGLCKAHTFDYSDAWNKRFFEKPSWEEKVNKFISEVEEIRKDITKFSSINLSYRGSVINFYSCFFKHDDEGYLSGYTVSNPYDEGTAYPITKKRKV